MFIILIIKGPLAIKIHSIASVYGVRVNIYGAEYGTM